MILGSSAPLEPPPEGWRRNPTSSESRKCISRRSAGVQRPLGTSATGDVSLPPTCRRRLGGEIDPGEVLGGNRRPQVPSQTSRFAAPAVEASCVCRRCAWRADYRQGFPQKTPNIDESRLDSASRMRVHYAARNASLGHIPLWRAARAGRFVGDPHGVQCLFPAGS